MPWRIGEITLKNVANIDEYAVQFDQYNLKVANEIKGFDPKHFFMKHMIYVCYNVSYENTFLFGEEEDDDKNPKEFPIEDIDTIIITNEPH